MGGRGLGIRKGGLVRLGFRFGAWAWQHRRYVLKCRV